MTPDASSLCRLRPPPHISRVRIADGTLLPVTSIGHLSTSTFSVPAVSYIPRLSMSLMSVSQLTDLDCQVIFHRTSCRVQDRSGVVIGAGRRHSGVYALIPFDFHLLLAQLITVMLLFSLTSCGIIGLATCVLPACLPLLIMVY